MNPTNDSDHLTSNNHYNPLPSDPFHYQNPFPLHPTPQKRKWLAGLLSFFVPGIGHFYLGLMQRGLFIMGLVILDIITIVYFATSDTGRSIPLITLFSLLLPVIYFYNVFDALQSTDFINRRYELGSMAFAEHAASHREPLQKLLHGNNIGIILISAGVIFFLLSTKPSWFEGIFKMLGSYTGAIILIVAGAAMFLLDSRKK